MYRDGGLNLNIAVLKNCALVTPPFGNGCGTILFMRFSLCNYYVNRADLNIQYILLTAYRLNTPLYNY